MVSLAPIGDSSAVGPLSGCPSCKIRKCACNLSHLSSSRSRNEGYLSQTSFTASRTVLPWNGTSAFPSQNLCRSSGILSMELSASMGPYAPPKNHPFHFDRIGLGKPLSKWLGSASLDVPGFLCLCGAKIQSTNPIYPWQLLATHGNSWQFHQNTTEALPTASSPARLHRFACSAASRVTC